MAQLADTQVVAGQLWRQSGLTPADMDLANIYDHFSSSVLMTLEALGFCGPGEAAAFIRDEGIGLDGRLPLNTNGGQLGEAYIHGFNGIATRYPRPSTLLSRRAPTFPPADWC
jgi:acetyl-CoA acetyltransferase